MKRPGFTLVELIVVGVLLAVIAGAIVPRLVRNDGRSAAVTVESVRQLLSAAAERQVLTSQRLALDLSGGDGASRLALLAPADPRRELAGADGWEIDRLAPPVALGEVRVVAALLGETRAGGGPWRVELSTPVGRPAVMLALRDGRTGRMWRVDLPAQSLAARATEVESAAAAAALPSGTIDLDQSGMRDQPW